MHSVYNSIAAKKNNPKKMSNILDILKGLYEYLVQYDVPSKDIEQFDLFLRGIQSSIRIRERTFQMTNMVSDVVFTMIYIIIWANETQKLDIDIDILARRKALESELTKILEKTDIHHEHAGTGRIRQEDNLAETDIHDRFGIRGIVLNNDSEDDKIETEKLFILSNYYHNILTKSSRKDYYSFLDWVGNNPKIDDYTKGRLIHLLKIPFKIYNIKDYITNPKPNGYQSLHFVLQAEMYSDYMPGAEFEVQLRTLTMHQHAVNGESNHQIYKDSIDDNIKAVFTIDDFSKVNIAGFTSYNSVDDDIDGIHWAKQLVNRRISNSLVV